MGSKLFDQFIPPTLVVQTWSFDSPWATTGPFTVPIRSTWDQLKQKSKSICTMHTIQLLLFWKAAVFYWPRNWWCLFFIQSRSGDSQRQLTTSDLSEWGEEEELQGPAALPYPRIQCTGEVLFFNLTTWGDEEQLWSQMDSNWHFKIY